MIILIIGVAGYAVIARNKKPSYDFAIVKRDTLVQEVSVTGKVKSAESVDLAFEKSGKVDRVYVKVGDKILAGSPLVSLENGELAALVLQAQANYEAELAKLSELQKGTRLEELQQAETKVTNAQRSLEDAQNNLEDVKTKAVADLDNAYDAALTSAQEAVNTAKSSLLALTDLQYAHFTGIDEESNKIADTKAVAVQMLLGVRDAGRWTNDFLSVQTGGVYGEIQALLISSTEVQINAVLSSCLDALYKVKEALDTIPAGKLTSTEKTNLATEKTNINSELSTVSGKQQAVLVQKALNDSNIQTAQASVNTAKNTLASAQDDLALKRAGAVAEQIASQAARVKSAQATVQNYQAQLRKTVITAPIAGTVTKQDAKVGEIVAINALIVLLLSEAQYEIEADIPEVDVAKVKIGDLASTTLDAYGPDVNFPAKVVSIEPAETVISGVIYYKAKLFFENPDERLKSGMTANVDILTDRREDVLVVPQRAIIEENGKKWVRVIDPKNLQKFEKREVKTGIGGALGSVEILSGVNEGETIITFVKK